MEIDEQIEKTWTSTEGQANERKKAEDALARMKALERECLETRERIIEKTAFGTRCRYLKHD